MSPGTGGFGDTDVLIADTPIDSGSCAEHCSLDGPEVPFVTVAD